MRLTENHKAFFALLRAGLWAEVADQARDEGLGAEDWNEVHRLASEQSVSGIVLAGIEQLPLELRPPKMLLLQWIGEVQILEQQNKAMNEFIAVLVEKMRATGIKAILVKGQGIAQCYEKPLWRSCGDVDFFMDAENYEKAKALLITMASSVEPEGIASKHQGLNIDSWVVESHGTLHGGLSVKLDRRLDAIMQTVFDEGNVRTWENGGCKVLLPRADEDVVYVFTHILQHFYKGGIGVRQICDWCRLLWMYRNSIDRNLLETRLRSLGLISQWRAFAAFATHYLGFPVTAYSLLFADINDTRLRGKADKICEFVLEVGNFGHNRNMSYYDKYPYVIRKAISFGQRMGDLWRHAKTFPLESLRFFPTIVFCGVRSAVRGE